MISNCYYGLQFPLFPLAPEGGGGGGGGVFPNISYMAIWVCVWFLSSLVWDRIKMREVWSTIGYHLPRNSSVL